MLENLIEKLEKKLNENLIDARVEPCTLPECSNLSLYLINSDYPQHNLSHTDAAALMENPPFWSFCWASGHILAQHLLQNPDLVKNKVVVDFGSGSGVVAIAAVMAGAKKVIACDIDPIAQTAIKSNALLNKVSLNICGDINSIKEKADILTAADVLYDKENFPLLDLFHAHAQQVIVADSRVKNFPGTDYRLIKTKDSQTIPDMNEFDEFKTVRIYQYN